MPTMRATSPTRASGYGQETLWRVGSYLTDGTRLLRVLRVDAEGAEVEDSRTQQLEWHPVRQLARATRAVAPLSIP